MTKMRARTLVTALAATTVTLLLMGSGCGNDPQDAADEESKNRTDAYNEIVENQPPVSGNYSPTRETINRWKQTWMRGPKLAYVYLIASNGQSVGYYILEAPPVSYCARITRPYEWVDIPNDGGNSETMAPAPADDAVWYSGNECNVYYGYEPVTAAYHEWAIGNGLTHLVSDQPLPRQDAEPLGISVAEVEAAGADD